MHNIKCAIDNLLLLIRWIRCYGEIALLYNDKRTASITAITDCETQVLSGDVFKQIIALNSIKRRNISLEYLDKVELFKGLE